MVHVNIPARGNRVLRGYPHRRYVNVGMGQASQKRGFALQATDLFRVGRKLWQEYLAGEGADQASTPDLVELGDASSA